MPIAFSGRSLYIVSFHVIDGVLCPLHLSHNLGPGAPNTLLKRVPHVRINRRPAPGPRPRHSQGKLLLLTGQSHTAACTWSAVVVHEQVAREPCKHAWQARNNGTAAGPWPGWRWRWRGSTPRMCAPCMHPSPQVAHGVLQNRIGAGAAVYAGAMNSVAVVQRGQHPEQAASGRGGFHRDMPQAEGRRAEPDSEKDSETRRELGWAHPGCGQPSASARASAGGEARIATTSSSAFPLWPGISASLSPQ